MLESPNARMPECSKARMLRRLANEVYTITRTFPRDEVWGLAELDTQFLIAEMQGYARYSDELKARVAGLMAGIRAFSATLSKA